MFEGCYSSPSLHSTLEGGGGRGAGLLHQQRRDIVREVKRLRLVRLGKKRHSDGSGDAPNLKHVIGFAWPDACPGTPWPTRGRAGCHSDP